MSDSPKGVDSEFQIQSSFRTDARGADSVRDTRELVVHEHYAQAGTDIITIH